MIVLAGAVLPACSSGEPGSTAASDRRAGAAATPSTPRPAATVDPASPSSATVTLAFGGDVHFEGVDRSRLLANPRTAMGPIASVLGRADVAMVNLETAVTTRGTPQPKAFTFHAPRSAFVALRSAGVDVATQANNHGMDFGLVGLRDSIEAADEAQFPVVGIGMDADAAYAPHIATVRGERIAFLGATQVLDDNLVSAWTAGPGKPGLASAKEVPRLLAAVRTARSRADVVVVYLHWGTEMHSCPTGVQTELADALARAGADVIVGSHAHVLLGGGTMGGSYIHYGLGNFVFYARSGPTLESGVLTLTLRGREVREARWSPARISGGVPVPLEGSAARAALRSWQQLRACTGLGLAQQG